MRRKAKPIVDFVPRIMLTYRVQIQMPSNSNRIISAKGISHHGRYACAYVENTIMVPVLEKRQRLYR